MWKLRSPLVENPELTDVLLLKSGVSGNIGMHASPTARNFCSSFPLSDPFFSFFSLSLFLLLLSPLSSCVVSNAGVPVK